MQQESKKLDELLRMDEILWNKVRLAIMIYLSTKGKARLRSYRRAWD